MKKIFLIMGLIVGLLSGSVVAQNDSAWNQVNSEGLKEGAWRDYHKNGQLRYEGQFRQGEPFDVFKFYFSTGELKTVLTYNEDKPNEAYATHYYQTGEKMAEGNYLNQKKNGLWKTYRDNEVLLSEGSYISGKKYGYWKTYYANGQLAKEVLIENDLEQGPLKEYFDNGELKQEATYKDGFKEGMTIIYTPEGDTAAKGSYYKDARDGEWTYFDENKEIEKVLKYEKGRLLNPEDADDNVESMEEFKDNRKKELEFEDLRGKIKYE